MVCTCPFRLQVEHLNGFQFTTEWGNQKAEDGCFRQMIRWWTKELAARFSCGSVPRNSISRRMANLVTKKEEHIEHRKKWIEVLFTPILCDIWNIEVICKGAASMCAGAECHAPSFLGHRLRRALRQRRGALRGGAARRRRPAHRGGPQEWRVVPRGQRSRLGAGTHHWWRARDDGGVATTLCSCRAWYPQERDLTHHTGSSCWHSGKMVNRCQKSKEQPIFWVELHQDFSSAAAGAACATAIKPHFARRKHRAVQLWQWKQQVEALQTGEFMEFPLKSGTVWNCLINLAWWKLKFFHIPIGRCVELEAWAAQEDWANHLGIFWEQIRWLHRFPCSECSWELTPKSDSGCSAGQTPWSQAARLAWWVGPDATGIAQRGTGRWPGVSDFVAWDLHNRETETSMWSVNRHVNRLSRSQGARTLWDFAQILQGCHSQGVWYWETAIFVKNMRNKRIFQTVLCLQFVPRACLVFHWFIAHFLDFETRASRPVFCEVMMQLLGKVSKGHAENAGSWVRSGHIWREHILWLYIVHIYLQYNIN